jgi:hypothetical protein
MVCTFEVDNQPIDENDPWSGIQSTPGQLLFGQDMIWEIAHIADWQYIKQRKKILINNSNKRENDKLVDYDYAIGESIMKIKAGTLKMEQPRRQIMSDWTIFQGAGFARARILTCKMKVSNAFLVDHGHTFVICWYNQASEAIGFYFN